MRTLLWICCCILFFNANAQNTPSKIAEKTKNMKRYDGYFTFWWDTNTGKIWLQADKFNQEFLYVSTLPYGVGSNDLGLDRGQIGETKILK